MSSVVGICNRALQKVGQSDRIASITENSAAARACNAAYEPVRDALLRRHVWSFAVKRASLPSTTTPEHGYGYAYTLPSDYVRLAPLDQDEEAYMSKWKVEDGKILTNDTAPLDIRYVYKVEDPNKFDTLFRELLAAEIGIEICEELTQSHKKKEVLIVERRGLVAEAKKVNAVESPPVEGKTDSWITARL